MGRAATRAVGGSVAAAVVAKAGGGIAAAPAAADGGPYPPYPATGCFLIGYCVNDVMVNGARTNTVYAFRIASDDSGCPGGFGALDYWSAGAPPLATGFGFADLGGCVSQFDVGDNWDGRLEVFAKGTNGAIYHDWMTLPANNFAEYTRAGVWSGWYSLGAVGSGFVRGPSVESPGISDTIMKAHAWDASGNVWVRERPNSSWNPWIEL